MPSKNAGNTLQDESTRPAGGQSPLKTKKRKGVTERNRPLWMLTPGGFLITVIILIPLALALYMSVIDLDQYTLRKWLTTPFVGLDNYIEAITKTDLLRSIWISISFAVLSTIITVPLGVAAAVVTQNPYRGRAIVRAVFLIPYVLPSFVVATVWRTMLQPDGIVNSVLNNVGIDPALWLNGPMSYWTLVGVEIWAAWPFIYLLALAGLQSVDMEVHEAAAIDGALWWRKLREVIFPYLKGPVALAFLLGTLNHINNFTLPYVLFGAPAPADVNVLPILVYVTSFQSFRFGLSAAMAVVSLILIAIPLFIYLRAVKLDVSDEGGKK
ncbi:multiple sugar transport system permease protein [Arthrobacter stackebrandtii]|uniref:Multiple sugar transport system permease protein n=1 Tax=Arthrobacter stackebrandtii TaxID=272161 RepID=A0ABS4YYG0_9MICC|nr:sugar ABC transporter permease [Arthrobacter stackebrandtii]MBP2413822.1 multiple sugar transport system permease protein [Arthrobacter stackebrandtii]PYH00401.1 sugar ABC transporter permease [Arthrobacter stackebrandtii]